MINCDRSIAPPITSPPPMWGRVRVGGNRKPQRSRVPPPLGYPVGVCGKGRRLQIAWIRAIAGPLLLYLMSGAIVAQSAELTFDLKIEKGRVAKNMRTIRVNQGDAVKLRWTADRPIVLHLHGYDIEKKVEPGTVAEMSFVARATGRFSVEEHKPDAKGGHSHGEALVRIDVLPK
jgi:hypothetical protein